jgi:hypothetical protein
MIDLEKILVSIFDSAWGKTPETITLAAILERIRKETYGASITKLRRLRATDPERYSKEKRKLPAFTVSGIAKDRKTLERHSGLLQLDLDNLGERLNEVRDRILGDPHVLLIFTSPGGAGLKLIMVIEGSRHYESCLAAEGYVRAKYGENVDRSCKDVLRLCFVSSDPGILVNLKAVPLPLPPKLEKGGPEASIRLNPESFIPETLDDCGPESLSNCDAGPLDPCDTGPLTPCDTGQLGTCGTGPLDDCTTGPLGDCTPTPLHNSPEEVLANIRAKAKAQREFAENHPALVSIYNQLIEPRFQALPGTRNTLITQFVPFLYVAVAARFVPILGGHFFDCNQRLFKDSRQQHMHEVNEMLKLVAASYEKSLSADQLQIYQTLNPIDRDIFRICRDLAKLSVRAGERAVFYLAYGHLAARVGVYPTQAQRAMCQFAIFGILKLVKKGTRRAPGMRGEAGTYEWLLPLPPDSIPPREETPKK